MDTDQIKALEPAFASYLDGFRRCFESVKSFRHLRTYCRGLMSDLARKSVEPIALAAGTAVRTLQEFLASHVWDHARMCDLIQRRIVEEHLPAPGEAVADPLGVVGWVDETSVAKKGDKTPGVQRQYCGASGKIDNCIVTVHLACSRQDFMALLSSDLFLPQKSWDQDRDRCDQAHIPDEVVYRPKWKISLEQIDRALANGVRLDWMTFDEWYGSKPGYLDGLQQRGLLYVGEVPRNLPCFPSRPKYHSAQRPFAPKRADNAATWGKPFRGQKWRKMTLQRKTLAPQHWLVKAGQVYLSRDSQPTDRTYWLIVAKSLQTGEVKYFISNAPAKTALATLMRVAFTRAGVEHIFRLAKTEVGFGHFEGRSYQGLLRHMILCQLVFLFIAQETHRLRGEKPAGDHGADCPGAQCPLPELVGAPLPAIGS